MVQGIIILSPTEVEANWCTALMQIILYSG